MAAYTLDPLTDARWPAFLARHPAASMFHTPGWLAALRRSYGYEPLVMTTCAPGRELTDGVAFCRVGSRLTGRRLVSLPFSDHCEPLADSESGLNDLLGAVGSWQAGLGCGHAELRPLHVAPTPAAGFGPSDAFFMHELELRGSAAEILRGFAKDSIQRKIRRAEREDLVCDEGRSEKLIGAFYALQLLTRRRHGFRRSRCNGSRSCPELGEDLKFRIAFRGGAPIAGIVTLRYKQTMIYKYGSSDAAHHNTGALQLLFWNAIRESLDGGLERFDFGRSDLDNEGLAVFKDRWGRNPLPAVVLAQPACLRGSRASLIRPLAQEVFSRIPDRLLTLSGRLLYKHLHN